MMRAGLSSIALLGAVLLAGCSAENEELQQWMDQQKREVKPSVTPLAPPKKFNPQPYASAQAVDPFSLQKLSVALKSSRSASFKAAGPQSSRATHWPSTSAT